MQTAAPRRVERCELPSMIATLCSYQDFFGPHHPQTLCLMTEVGVAFWCHGELVRARCLLELAIRDLERYLGREHDVRLRAIAALRDLFIQQGEYENAEAVQKELLECHIQRLGGDHPQTAATRADLATIILETIQARPNKEV